MAKFESGLH